MPASVPRSRGSQAPRVFAVLGDPVGHSLSPLIHNAAIRQLGLHATYVALRCGAADCGSLMRKLARAGGGGNVTVPHKELAAKVVDRPSQAVLRTGACNTFWYAGDALMGENTDVEGFRRALRDLTGDLAAGARVLLAGAGGSARAVLASLLPEKVGEVAILNRTPARAHALALEAGDPRVRVLDGPADLRGEAFDLLVNATSLGLSPDDPLAIPLDDLRHVGAVLDLVYGSGETPLTSAARSRGIPAGDGKRMLVYQGAAAFECWWGRPAPVEAMFRALGAALEP